MPQPVNFPDLKVFTCTPANSIFDDPRTNLLSILCVLIEVLSCGHAKGGKGLNDFRFGTSIGHFPSDCGKHGSQRVKCLFCSLIKEITPKICILCFVLINSVILNILCV